MSEENKNGEQKDIKKKKNLKDQIMLILKELVVHRICLIMGIKDLLEFLEIIKMVDIHLHQIIIKKKTTEKKS